MFFVFDTETPLHSPAWDISIFSRSRPVARGKGGTYIVLHNGAYYILLVFFSSFTKPFHFIYMATGKIPVSLKIHTCIDLPFKIIADGCVVCITHCQSFF